MQTIKIILLKSDIIEMIGQNTDYAGMKTETADRASFHERVATNTSDGDLLARYWEEACGTLTDALRTFITEVQIGRETLTMTLDALRRAVNDALGQHSRKSFTRPYSPI